MNRQALFVYLQFFRCIPADFLYLFSPNRKLIEADLERYLAETPYQKCGVRALNYSLLLIKNYRNVFYYRTENSHVLRIISRFLLPQLDALEIHGQISGGLRVYHNYGVIHPYRAGKNFTVHHGVTIGKGRPSEIDSKIVDPTFGDNIEIMSGAIVFGGIKVGDNVVIGAGTVVNKDVPDNSLVVGNPMRILKSSSDNHAK